MPKSEDIFRNPKELEELKSKVRPEVYLSSIYEQIFKIETELENKKQKFIQTVSGLEIDSEIKRKELWKDIDLLENVLAIKRAERIQLDRPFIDRTGELNQREIEIIEARKVVSQDQQKAFEIQRMAENKLEDVQILADQLGETRVRQMVKEHMLQEREKNVKGGEQKILLGFDSLYKRQQEVKTELKLREDAVELKELNVTSEKDNLVKREKELLDGHIWLNDQRGVLARAWQELKNKQNGRSTKQLPKRR